MTFLELQTAVSEIVDDLSFSYFTRTQVKRFLNNAQKQIQKYLIDSGNNWYLKVASDAILVVNQSDYTLPTDFDSLNRLIIVQNPGVNESTMDLSAITLNQSAFFPVTAQNPVAFYLKKNKIVMVPTPTTATYYYRLFYSYLVPDMVADADIPDVPDQYLELLQYLAIRDCFIKDGRDASEMENKIKVYTDEFKAHMQERVLNGPRMVVMTEGDTGYGW